jgi:hypothetical protein
MTLSINCKDAGDPFNTHTMYGETKEELFKNAKEHMEFKSMVIQKRHVLKR